MCRAEILKSGAAVIEGEELAHGVLSWSRCLKGFVATRHKVSENMVFSKSKANLCLGIF